MRRVDCDFVQEGRCTTAQPVSTVPDREGDGQFYEDVVGLLRQNRHREISGESVVLQLPPSGGDLTDTDIPTCVHCRTREQCGQRTGHHPLAFPSFVGLSHAEAGSPLMACSAVA